MVSSVNGVGFLVWVNLGCSEEYYSILESNIIERSASSKLDSSNCSLGGDRMIGILNINKPAGWTSRDVVNRVQRLVRPAKAGHAGTLDPLATGGFGCLRRFGDPADLLRTANAESLSGDLLAGSNEPRARIPRPRPLNSPMPASPRLPRSTPNCPSFSVRSSSDRRPTPP